MTEKMLTRDQLQRLRVIAKRDVGWLQSRHMHHTASMTHHHFVQVREMTAEKALRFLKSFDKADAALLASEIEKGT